MNIKNLVLQITLNLINLLAAISLIWGITMLYKKYSYRPSCVSLSEPVYYDIKDNLSIMIDVLLVLFFPTVFLLIKYTINKTAKWLMT
jgi:hypothetical protein